MRNIPVIKRASYLSKGDLSQIFIDIRRNSLHVFFVCEIVIDDCAGSAVIDPASYDKRCRNLQYHNNEHENCSKWRKTIFFLEIITYFLYGLTKQYYYGVVYVL